MTEESSQDAGGSPRCLQVGEVKEAVGRHALVDRSLQSPLRP